MTLGCQCRDLGIAPDRQAALAGGLNGASVTRQGSSPGGDAAVKLGSIVSPDRDPTPIAGVGRICLECRAGSDRRCRRLMIGASALPTAPDRDRSAAQGTGGVDDGTLLHGDDVAHDGDPSANARGIAGIYAAAYPHGSAISEGYGSTVNLHAV